MKVPQWMETAPEGLAHEEATLQKAARVVRLYAKDLGKAERGAFNREAKEARQIAAMLDAAAGGKTWADAFDLPVRGGSQ